MTDNEKQPTAEELIKGLNRRLRKASDNIIKDRLATGEYVYYEGRIVPAYLIEQIEQWENDENSIRIVKSSDEESFSLYVGDAYIKSFNYDTHGSQAMSDAEDLVKKLADALDIEVKYEEEE